jgi:acyl-CoA synthetase (NDP forming)
MSTVETVMMLEPQAITLLNEYGIPYPDHGYVQSAEEAVETAKHLGYPVVLKVVSPDVIHKSDVGGVAAEIEDDRSLTQVYMAMQASVRERVPGADVHGMLVCRQAPPGLEVIVGALKDAQFGPALMFGLGGVFAEVLKDTTFRIIPVQRLDAEEMVREIRGYPLLTGARGLSSRDIAALVDLLLAVSRMVSEHPEIEELDLNPVRLYEQGLMALDARILLAKVVEEQETQK